MTDQEQEDYFDHLIECGFVEEQNGRWVLTPAGKRHQDLVNEFYLSTGQLERTPDGKIVRRTTAH